MLKNILALFLILLMFCLNGVAQNYISKNSGNWTSSANWNKTSGWGSSVPKRSGNHYSGTVNINHDMFIGGNYTLGSNTVNINAGHSLDIVGDLVLNGGSLINVYGDLVVSGKIVAKSHIKIYAGGTLTVDGNVKIKFSDYLQVGNSGSSGLSYAGFVVKGNLNSETSGDFKFYTNSRVAVGGNVQTVGNNGGTIFSVQNGGQVYVDNNIVLTGGGDNIYNYNSITPWGLYVKGSVSNTGGGSSTTNNITDDQVMISTNVPFANWVGAKLGIALPVEWGGFSATIDDGEVKLNWRTMMEINNDYFKIQRSTNLKDWETIDQIEGYGNKQTPSNYKTFDYNPLFGISYYRIIQTDFDGKRSTSKYVFVENNKNEELEVFPNPSNGVFKIKGGDTKVEKVIVFNSNGEVVVLLTPNHNGVMSLDLSEYVSGVYTIQTVSKSGFKTRKIILK